MNFFGKSKDNNLRERDKKFDDYYIYTLKLLLASIADENKKNNIIKTKKNQSHNYKHIGRHSAKLPIQSDNLVIQFFSCTKSLGFIFSEETIISPSSRCPASIRSS